MVGDHPFAERFYVVALALLFSQFSHCDFHHSASGGFLHESLVLYGQRGTLGGWRVLCCGHSGRAERRDYQRKNTKLRNNGDFGFHGCVRFEICRYTRQLRNRKLATAWTRTNCDFPDRFVPPYVPRLRGRGEMRRAIRLRRCSSRTSSPRVSPRPCSRNPPRKSASYRRVIFPVRPSARKRDRDCTRSLSSSRPLIKFHSIRPRVV